MKNPVQFDHNVRIVSLANLIAMADRVSATCHRFTVSKVSASRVSVEYSNPDEYGNENPVTVQFPCFPGHFGTTEENRENPSVVLQIARITGAKGDSEAWQAFGVLLDCPVLWRDPQSGNWQTEYEIRIARYPQFAIKSVWDKDGCIQTWYANGDATGFSDYRKAQTRAIELAKNQETKDRENLAQLDKRIAEQKGE